MFTILESEVTSAPKFPYIEVPDSTIREREWHRHPFCEGEDVLVEGQDGLVYLGIVVEVDADLGQCLVRFGDCTERWSSFFELKRLGCDEEENETILTPPKSRLELLHEELKLEETSDRHNNLPAHVIEARQQLSYDFDSLVWDTDHHRNDKETYCYCGESGDWYKKMLQCHDCLQWFHQECIRSLSFQLLCGDRFFEFVCTLCNGKDEEYIRRLDLSVVDGVHLVLFNLILIKNQKFHDLETSVIPFIKKRLKYLQGNPNNPTFKTGKIETEAISKLLASNKSRFKCGSETGKKSSYWGLRKMCPPSLPSKYLNPSRTIGRWAPNNFKSPAECDNKPPTKSGRLAETTLKKSLTRNPQIRQNKRRLKDLAGDHSDSDASSKGTLDFLIKTPKDFIGPNNPFRTILTESDCRSDFTPSSSLSRLLSSEKGSPVSSGAPSTVTTDDSLVEDIPQTPENVAVGDVDKSSIDKNSRIKLEDLKGTLTSYLFPTAKKRLERGDKFKVKARRLTLNGDIAYLIEWENSGDSY